MDSLRAQGRGSKSDLNTRRFRELYPVPSVFGCAIEYSTSLLFLHVATAASVVQSSEARQLLTAFRKTHAQVTSVPQFNFVK